MDAIRTSLSEPRFGSYLAKGGGDEGYALALYLYNARLAKAFLFPLHVVEVTLRNAIDHLLVARYGPVWPFAPEVRHHLLMPQGVATLDKAVGRAGTGASRSQVVAELTFDFWSNLLRPDYHQLWRTGLNVAFPRIGGSIGRHEVQVMAKEVNVLRNRVAHHEPILDLNAPTLHARINDLVALRCAETAAWMRHHSTVGAILRTRPRNGRDAGATLSSRLAPDFVSATPAMKLAEVMGRLDRTRQAVVCVDGEGRTIAAFSSLDVVRFVCAEAERDSGLFAPGERTVQDLMDEVDLAGRWIAMADDVPIATAVDALRGPKIDVLVGVDRGDGSPKGTILRAHRRY